MGYVPPEDAGRVVTRTSLTGQGCGNTAAKIEWGYSSIKLSSDKASIGRPLLISNYN